MSPCDELWPLTYSTTVLVCPQGMLKSKSQKIENNLEDTQKNKNKLMAERDDLFKENQDVSFLGFFYYFF